MISGLSLDHGSLRGGGGCVGGSLDQVVWLDISVSISVGFRNHIIFNNEPTQSVA